MSTPSTATAVHPPLHNHFFPHYTAGGYPPPTNSFRTNSSSNNSLTRLALSNYGTNNSSTPDLRPITTTTTNTQATKPQLPVPVAPKNDPVAQSPRISPEMSTSQRRDKKANWNEYYKNGLPKEIIVIEDDSPEPVSRGQKRDHESPEQPSRPVQVNGKNGHTDKRRRVDANTNYDPVYYESHKTSTKESAKADSTSIDADSRDRTTSALYSTAPTSLGSSTGSGRGQKPAETQVGQKRKRQARKVDEEEEDIEILAQKNTWDTYVPPTKPLIKAPDVYVQVIRDVSAAKVPTQPRQSAKGNQKGVPAGQKFDDDDGHYVVIPNADFTERYTITRLLGQGTFGKVIEAYDKQKRTKCAVKIIRAVQKYRDASRIELRVLKTLASNDKFNRNKCIHLRDCFDFRNHICIVTDLLSSSVFDFLKNNAFVPFPSTHIQSFARQLLTSVAFLHDLNLIHTDLKPENILLVNDAYQTFTYNRNIPSSSKSVARQARLRRVLLNPEIRLIDFGSATFDDEYHSSVVSTRHYRAPEIILNLGWSFPCDIWSIGCILVEFFTGDALFQTHDNLEHLAMMEAVCNGKIDKDIVDKVRLTGGRATKNTAASYFRPKAYALNYPNSETVRTSRKYVKNMKRLDEIIPATTEFNRRFLDLLHRIFVYDPRKRITAKQALNHPWFREVLQDDGTEALKIRLEKERASFR